MSDQRLSLHVGSLSRRYVSGQARWIMRILLTALAVTEHVALIYWGALWPLHHLAAYPNDGGVNRYFILATSLLICVNLASATAFRTRFSCNGLLAMMTVNLPAAILLLLFLLNLAPLDPVLYYLALLPAAAALMLPYQLLGAPPRPPTE